MKILVLASGLIWSGSLCDVRVCKVLSYKTFVCFYFLTGVSKMVVVKQGRVIEYRSRFERFNVH